jgi:hypothetical protein
MSDDEMIGQIPSQPRVFTGVEEHHARILRAIVVSCGLLLVHAACVVRFGIRAMDRFCPR